MMATRSARLRLLWRPAAPGYAALAIATAALAIATAALAIAARPVSRRWWCAAVALPTRRRCGARPARWTASVAPRLAGRRPAAPPAARRRLRAAAAPSARAAARSAASAPEAAYRRA